MRELAAKAGPNVTIGLTKYKERKRGRGRERGSREGNVWEVPEWMEDDGREGIEMRQRQKRSFL